MNRERDLYLDQVPTRGDIVDAIEHVADSLAADPARQSIASAFYDLADQFMPLGHRVERQFSEGKPNADLDRREHLAVMKGGISPIESAAQELAGELRSHLRRPFKVDDVTEAYFDWSQSRPPETGTRTWIDCFRAGAEWAADLATKKRDEPRVNDPRVIASITSHVVANILIAEEERQSRLHDLLEVIREQIRTGVPPEHRPEDLFKNIQNALYAMRGRHLLSDVIAALLSSRSIDRALLRDIAVQRFLSWPLPADFSPDGGIALAPHYVAATGTNLFNALQAGAMVDHVLGLDQPLAEVIESALDIAEGR